MKFSNIPISIIFIFIYLNVNSQSIDTSNVITGVLLDVDTELPLPYANIFVLNTHIGEVSNEKGAFSIDVNNLSENDTIRFQYIGYTSFDASIKSLRNNSTILLKEHIFNLNEAVIFAREPNIRSIIKKVLENKDSNYRATTSKRQIFTRERYISNFKEIKLNYKKSSIEQLNKDLIKMIEESIPKNSTSYTDFLGDIYTSANQDDSIVYKIDPIRAVSLKEKDIAELEQLEEMFENIFSNTNEEEYWKVKSGIFAQKLDIDHEEEKPEKDTINKNEAKTSNFQRRTSYKFNFSSFKNKNEWEFLYHPGRYNFELIGGTRVNGEDVYIIDFTPRSNGQFIGRVFISIVTSALVRADYSYAEGKVGRDFQLLGVGYTENEFTASIYFEKKEDNYLLKYYSKKAGSDVSLDRNIALLKKRKRFLFDRKLMELKIGVDMAVNSESSIELLIINEETIDQQNFYDFTQKEKMEIIYVDQFDDNLWKGYSIIEPTKQMKEYRKQKVDYNF